MKKSILHGIVYLISMIGLVGCGPEAELGFKPLIVPVRVSINTHGDLRVELTRELVTSIGTFDLGGGMTVFSIRGQYDQKVLLVSMDEQAVVYELEEGKEFSVTFDDNNTLYKKVALNYETDGDIVLELESVGDVGGVPTEPVTAVTTVTDIFYDLPEDGEVLNRFCTTDWETCRNTSEANANWQDINVASIGGSSFSDGYLVERAFLFFDTSSIPSAATIQNAVLYIYAGQFLNGNTTIHVAPSNANTPLTTSSFQKFTNVSGGSVALTAPYDWGSISFLSNALGWISPGDITRLVLIHDNDLNNVRPYEQNDVIIATGEDNINRPYLEITYTVP